MFDLLVQVLFLNYTTQVDEFCKSGLRMYFCKQSSAIQACGLCLPIQCTQLAMLGQLYTCVLCLLTCFYKCSSGLESCKFGFNLHVYLCSFTSTHLLCEWSLQVEFTRSVLHFLYCKLIDQPGVANFAYTRGSADLVYILELWFAYVVAESILQIRHAN